MKPSTLEHPRWEEFAVVPCSPFEQRAIFVEDKTIMPLVKIFSNLGFQQSKAFQHTESAQSIRGAMFGEFQRT